MSNQPAPINLDQLADLTDEQQEYLEEPVLALVGKNVHEMSFEEVDLHIARLRALRTGAESVKRALKDDAIALKEKKPRATKAKKQIDMSKLW